MRIIGDRIREARVAAGMSQAELAKSLKQCRALIGHWESGEREPMASTIAKLSGIFHVSADWLLGLTDTKKR